MKQSELISVSSLICTITSSFFLFNKFLYLLDTSWNILNLISNLISFYSYIMILLSVCPQSLVVISHKLLNRTSWNFSQFFATCLLQFYIFFSFAITLSEKFGKHWVNFKFEFMFDLKKLNSILFWICVYSNLLRTHLFQLVSISIYYLLDTAMADFFENINICSFSLLSQLM